MQEHCLPNTPDSLIPTHADKKRRQPLISIAFFRIVACIGVLEVVFWDIFSGFAGLCILYRECMIPELILGVQKLTRSGLNGASERDF